MSYYILLNIFVYCCWLFFLEMWMLGKTIWGKNLTEDRHTLLTAEHLSKQNLDLIYDQVLVTERHEAEVATTEKHQHTHHSRWLWSAWLEITIRKELINTVWFSYMRSKHDSAERAEIEQYFKIPDILSYLFILSLGDLLEDTLLTLFFSSVTSKWCSSLGSSCQ